MEINVKVVGQDLIVSEYFTYGLVEGSQKFVRFIFDLSSDWDGLTVFAQFIQNGHAYNQYLDANNTVELPSEIVAGPCAMLLFGSGSQVRATTSYLKMTISDYLLVEDAESTVITESLYEQLVDMVQDYKSDTDAEIEEFETLIRTFVGGPLVADTVADMTDHAKIYVYTGSETGYTSGNWYYWDGTAWVSGGVYNSIAIGDGSITTAKLADEAVTSAKLSDGAVKSDKIYQKAVTTEKIDDNAVTTPKIALNSIGEAHLKSGLRNTIDNKADQNGFYEDLSAGTATQLMSDAYQVEQSPYIFRASGGSLEIGDREQDTLVGMDLVWNQLLQNGNFESASGWNVANCTISVANNVLTATITNTNASIYKAVTYIESHKYLLIASVNPSFSTEMLVGGTRTAVDANKWSTIGGVISATSSTNVFRIYFDVSASTSSGTVAVQKCMLFDLTAMFGTEIANHIYTLEQSTAGAGVAWVKRYLTKDYYPYSAPTMQNGVASSHDMVGFNQWDEEWELGYYDMNGQKASSSNVIRSKNKIKIMPNTNYYFRVVGNSSTALNRYVSYYDADENYLNLDIYDDNGRKKYTYDTEFTTPNNAYYMVFSLGTAYGTTYNHDICITFHYDGERDGEYEPYIKHSYPLDDTVDLHGIPKIDASGNLYADGDTYEADGTVTRKYHKIDDISTLTFSRNQDVSGGTQYYVVLPSEFKAKNAISTGEIIFESTSDYFPSIGAYNGSGGSISFNRIFVTGSYIWIISDKTTVDEVKADFVGKSVVYLLATPTTESAEPFQTPQIVDNWGTEEYVTEGVIPIGHSTKYFEDLRGKIENLNLEMIAPIENGTTASQSYSVGQYFLHNNQFCKAKTSIASGATLTLNTNYEVTTIATELYTVLHS